MKATFDLLSTVQEGMYKSTLHLEIEGRYCQFYEYTPISQYEFSFKYGGVDRLKKYIKSILADRASRSLYEGIINANS